MTSQSAQWLATARLLRRAGFGATGPQIDAVAQQDWSTYLDAVLSLNPDADPGALATPRPTSTAPLDPGDPRAQKKLQPQLIAAMQDLTTWWVRRMAAVHEPIHEKLTLVWHNHFATSALKVPVAEWMGLQNQKLRTLKLGDFRTLAHTMLTDAAILYWLDGVTNSAGAPNENLSREFMELFTLGHADGYTETDVREGARALTGWFVDYGGKTAVTAERHDGTAKTVMGVTGNLDDAAFCDVVLNQPGSARFIAGKLWQLLASDSPPSAAALGRLVAAYGPGRDLKALTKAIFMDPEFTAAAGTVVNSPVEWVMGVVRALKVPIDNPAMLGGIETVLSIMGQVPFYPLSVGGWPRGQAWLSTTGTAARMWAADQFTRFGDISTVEHAPISDRIDAAGYLLGIGAWTDRSAVALKTVRANPDQLVTAAVNSPEYLTS